MIIITTIIVIVIKIIVMIINKVLIKLFILRDNHLRLLSQFFPQSQIKLMLSHLCQLPIAVSFQRSEHVFPLSTSQGHNSSPVTASVPHLSMNQDRGH